jgi:hypothetical protein
MEPSSFVNFLASPLLIYKRNLTPYRQRRLGRGWRVACVIWANRRYIEGLRNKEWEEGRRKT